MSEFLKEVDKIEQDFLGQDYEYYKFINSPKRIGMSSDGNMGALVRDVEGLVDYIKLLVAGDGRASKTGKPLGNRFFLKTPGKCKDIKTNKLVDRYMYISNQPSGSIPFISDETGITFSAFRGLIPGIISNMDAVNPMSMFNAFTEGHTPKCKEVRLETIDSNNRRSSQKAHVPIAELQELVNQNQIPSNTVSENFQLSSTDYDTLFNKLETLFNDSRIYSRNNLNNLFYFIIICLLAYYMYKQLSIK